jgi:phosphate-selective porin
MKSISFSDILTFPIFSDYTEDMLLNPKMDKYVMPYLHLLGGDINTGYQVVANKHRNLNNRVVIGYRYVMQSRTDYEYVHSNQCEVIDRIAAAAMKDPSLAVEMASLMNQSFNFSSFHEGGVDTDYGRENRVGTTIIAFPEELLEDDWKHTEAVLEAMKETILAVRGKPNKANGDLKGLSDYI